VLQRETSLLRIWVTWPYRNYFLYQQRRFYRVRCHNYVIITYLFNFVLSCIYLILYHPVLKSV